MSKHAEKVDSRSCLCSDVKGLSLNGLLSTETDQLNDDNSYLNTEI